MVPPTPMTLWTAGILQALWGAGVPPASRPKSSRATWTFLPTFISLLLTSPLSADSISLSILSILKPQQLTIVLRTPGSAVLQSDANQDVLLANAPLSITLQEGYLDTVRGSSKAIQIRCPQTCVIEITAAGLPAPRKYRGNIRITARDPAMNVVLQIEEVELLRSIVASEMGESREHAALQAFAVVSRTFLRSGRRHPELDTDFCDLTHCQVFQSYSSSKEASQAVDDTAELILKYRQRAFRPYYSRSCGGKTASFEEVWNEPSPDYPYTSVFCNCNTPWNARIHSAEVIDLIGGPLQSVVQQNNMLRLNNLTWTREQFRILIGRTLGWNRVRSNLFTVRQKGDKLEIQGNGIGHRVGFCQTGAIEIARRGNSFQQILAHYLPNTEILPSK